MPSRNNPNLPTRFKRWARTTSSTKHIRVTTTRTNPLEPVLKSRLGVSRGKTVASKALRKKERNRSYARDRTELESSRGLVTEVGEVLMRDVSEVPVSRRQAKLAARADKLREANAKKAESESTAVMAGGGVEGQGAGAGELMVDVE